MTETTHAILTLKGADEWTEIGRGEIANWLRSQADFLESKEVKLWGINKNFRARYISTTETDI